MGEKKNPKRVKSYEVYDLYVACLITKDHYNIYMLHANCLGYSDLKHSIFTFN